MPAAIIASAAVASALLAITMLLTTGMRRAFRLLTNRRRRFCRRLLRAALGAMLTGVLRATLATLLVTPMSAPILPRPIMPAARTPDLLELHLVRAWLIRLTGDSVG